MEKTLIKRLQSRFLCSVVRTHCTTALSEISHFFHRFKRKKEKEEKRISLSLSLFLFLLHSILVKLQKEREESTIDCDDVTVAR
jgi:hypothetical protein